MIKILMSVYNGEKYIREQLNSIFGQKVREKIKLYVRDDGSEDGTPGIIQEYADTYDIELTAGENMGPAQSFLYLLRHTDCAADDYIAFADQDDVWKEDKLQRAMDALEKYQRSPALYCSNVEYVERDLKPLQKLMHVNEPAITLMSQFVCGIAPGCTMMMNVMAAENIKKAGLNVDILHDNWSMLVVLCTGKVIYDHKSTVLYRQHENNAEAKEKNSFVDKWRKRLAKLSIKSSKTAEKTAQALLNEFRGNLDPKTAECLELLASSGKIRSRIKILLHEEAITDNRRGYFSFAVRLLLGRL